MELLSIKRRLKVALCSVSLSVMELNALSQNSQVGTQIRPQEVDLNLAASGNPVEMAALAGVGLTRSALALAEKIWGFAGDLSPKVKVAILCILMVALFAACSSPAIATETVVNSTPTTVSAPATLEPTATREPTATKVPTTAPTKIIAPTQEIKDYPNTMIDFNASVDFGIKNTVNVELAPKLHIRRWTPGTTVNGEMIAIPTVIELTGDSIFYLLSMIGSHLGQHDWQMRDDVIDKIWGFLDESPYSHGQQNLSFATGDMSSSLLTDNNPLRNYLDGDVANRMIAFAKSGGTDTTVLIRVKGIPYPVAFTFRINGPATSP